MTKTKAKKKTAIFSDIRRKKKHSNWTTNVKIDEKTNLKKKCTTTTTTLQIKLAFWTSVVVDHHAICILCAMSFAILFFGGIEIYKMKRIRFVKFFVRIVSCCVVHDIHSMKMWIFTLKSIFLVPVYIFFFSYLYLFHCDFFYFIWKLNNKFGAIWMIFYRN